MNRPLSVCGSKRPNNLSPHWVVSGWLEDLRTGPCDGLHKVVGDLPLVLKQVFNLCTVCITCKWERESSALEAGRHQNEKTERCSVLTCMTSIQVCSVAIVFAPTPHNIVQEVRLRHIHWGIYLHLPKDTITSKLIWYHNGRSFIPAAYFITVGSISWEKLRIYPLFVLATVPPYLLLARLVI